MSIISDPAISHVDITKFDGPNLLMNDEDTTTPQCLSCRNVEFVIGQARQRRGFGAAFFPAQRLRVMYNWIQEAVNRLLYLGEDNVIRVRNIETGVTSTLVQNVTAAGFTAAQAGYRIYLAYFSSVGTGVTETQAWDGTLTAAVPNIENVFHAPIHTSFLAAGTGFAGATVWGTFTSPGAGFVSPGYHAFCLIVTDWNGYQMAPGPSTTDVPNKLAFVYQQASSTAQTAISISVSPGLAWPLWVNTIQIAMTPVIDVSGGSPQIDPYGSGARWFLVPNQIATVTRGGSGAVTFSINLDDETLVGGGPTEITNTLFNLYHAQWGTGAVSVAGGSLSSISVSSNVGTVTYANPTGSLAQAVGNQVVVSGATGGGSGLNGSYYVQSVLGPGSFTITTSGVANGTYNNGALTVTFFVASGPTFPHCICALNNRTVYLTRLPGPDGVTVVGTILISEPGKPQYVTLAQHMLNLPEFRDTVTCFALGTVLYVLGNSWTYAFTDNLRVPVLWAPPRMVSQQIGSPFIRGVSVNQGKGYAWIGDHSGLYFFAGASYPIVPSSYKQTPDWSRINFAATQDTFRVIESPDDRLVIVRAALDGATGKSTHMLVWDYTYGTDADSIRYCGLWNIGSGNDLGDFEIVQAALTKIKELWVSTGDTQLVMRLKSIKAGDATDANPVPLYDDNGVGTDAAYKYLCVSRAADGPAMQIGARIRERGNGQIHIVASSFDEQRQQELAPITAGENSLLPGKRFDRFLDEQTPAIAYEFSNGAIPGAFFWLTAIRAYFTDWMADYE